MKGVKKVMSFYDILENPTLELIEEWDALRSKIEKKAALLFEGYREGVGKPLTHWERVRFNSFAKDRLVFDVYDVDDNSPWFEVMPIGIFLNPETLEEHVANEIADIEKKEAEKIKIQEARMRELKLKEYNKLAKELGL